MCFIKVIDFIFMCGFLVISTNMANAKSINPNINKTILSSTSSTSGLQQLKILRDLIMECENSSRNTTSSTTWQCLKLTSLRLFDEITTRDTVRVWNGIQFVRQNNLTTSKRISSELWKRMDLQYLTWFDRLALSFARLLSTHSLEINLKEVTDAFLQVRQEKDPVGTARHRRHRFNMMVTMMFGVTALGAVLVPMGFQLLSVVSGKALLLAKMALLLASINGLKRVANTGLHYGLYHVPGEHYGGYYDRGDVHHPRNVQNPTTGSQTLERELRM